MLCVAWCRGQTVDVPPAGEYSDQSIGGSSNILNAMYALSVPAVKGSGPRVLSGSFLQSDKDSKSNLEFTSVAVMMEGANVPLPQAVGGPIAGGPFFQGAALS